MTSPAGPLIPASVPRPPRATAPTSAFTRWMLQNPVQPVGPESSEETTATNSWWKVMCLTGVDYFPASRPWQPAPSRRWRRC